MDDGRTSLEDRAFEVKSLQQDVKHLSTRLEYMRRKSCICGQSVACVSAGLPRRLVAWEADLLLFDDL